jgi:hypothetical protein
VAQAQRVNFLAGLVTTEGGMIALIDLPKLLSLQVEEDEAADGRSPVLEKVA